MRDCRAFIEMCEVSFHDGILFINILLSFPLHSNCFLRILDLWYSITDDCLCETFV